METQKDRCAKVPWDLHEAGLPARRNNVDEKIERGDPERLLT
jgi:hypothetical protein